MDGSTKEEGALNRMGGSARPPRSTCDRWSQAVEGGWGGGAPGREGPAAETVRGCTKNNFGIETKVARWWNVASKRCEALGCTKQPAFGG